MTAIQINAYGDSEILVDSIREAFDHEIQGHPRGNGVLRTA